MNSTLKMLFIGKFSWQRVARSLILIPLFVYLGIFMLAWLIPDKIIFRPQVSSYRDDPSLIKLRTSTGETISAKFYENSTSGLTILFSHGNAEDIGTIDPFINTLRDAGFSVMTYDYRGYGTSEGTPSESNTYGDIEAAYDYLLESRGIPAERIILHGRSLGGGVSADLASRKPVGGLILESTFTSIMRVLTKVRIIPFDKYETIAKIGSVKCPVLIIHGKEDGTIPFHHGEALFAAANQPKFSFWVDDAGHNDVFVSARDEYLSVIKTWADNLNH